VRSGAYLHVCPRVELRLPALGERGVPTSCPDVHLAAGRSGGLADGGRNLHGESWRGSLTELRSPQRKAKTVGGWSSGGLTGSVRAARSSAFWSGVLALCSPAFAGPVLGSSCSESCRGGFRCVQLGHVCWCIEEMASCRASAGPSPDQSDTVSLCGLPWPPGGSSVVVLVLCACKSAVLSVLDCALFVLGAIT